MTGNVSHTHMRPSNTNTSAAGMACVVMMLLSSQCIAAQAADHADQRSHDARRGHAPYTQNSAVGHGVWVQMDFLRDWTAGQSGATNFTSYSNWRAYEELAGVWLAAEIPGWVLKLDADRNFSLATAASIEQRCSPGVERGNWTVTDDIDELRFHIKTDTSGHCGFSDRDTSTTILRKDTNLLLRMTDAAAGIRDIPLMRR